MRKSIAIVVGAAALIGIAAVALSPRDPNRSEKSLPRAQEVASALFVEATAELGLPTKARVWPDGTFALHEIDGGGAGLLDYDNDGDLDIVEVRYPPPGRPDEQAPNRLYQQQPDGRFVDVTEAARIGDPGYGQGLAVGDVDNDGDLDVYFTNFGLDAFYLNNGDGTFEAATESAGFSGDRWSSSAAFTDYDRDGDLDLFVVHYVVFEERNPCPNPYSAMDYCQPGVYQPTLDALYQNDGKGVFTDVTTEAGIDLPARGLGVLCADLTGDGWTDIYVANDGEANHLWVNQKDGRFRDEALLMGAAVSAMGKPESSMGLAVGDVNQDGLIDLFMTHFGGEKNTLYRTIRTGFFADKSAQAGMAPIDLPYTGFGCGLFDYDHDGDLDVAVVNGRTLRGQTLPGAEAGEFWNGYTEPNLLFENDGRGRFTDVSDCAGLFASRVEVGRGLAMGDIDNDGDVDMALTNLGGLRVYRNEAPAADSHWLTIRALVGNRDAIGAEVRIETDGRVQRRYVLPGYSFQSSNDPRVHFGLGKDPNVESVEITWPDGVREEFTIPGVDQQIVLAKGQGGAK
jgi:hypothetical protein